MLNYPFKVFKVFQVCVMGKQISVTRPQISDVVSARDEGEDRR